MLNKDYDFILMIEVIEHLRDPYGDLSNLKSRLRKGGKMFIKTQLMHPQRDFSSWPYQRDPTHVQFFSQKTFDYWKKVNHFSEMTLLNEDLILLTNE
jgi:hypothetical protein